ncbi:DUF7146 domain-containing protein [Xanthobacter sp. TB0136]|uniref:DUF7146 domain-containing protein n=1 Tax=Xanthobacter sp. TB0136 TaxID=3459177 RepID=UPI004039B4BE
MTAPDLSAWVEDARAVRVEEVLTRRSIKLRRAGTELVGPCPVCGGRDRFGVNLRKNLFHCRKSGRGGDAIALVEYLDGADFLAACEWLTGHPPPRGEGTRASAEELAAREAERRAREEKLRQEAESYREVERQKLYRQWKALHPLSGTAAEVYLRDIRGLDIPAGAHLRFARDLPYYHGKHMVNGRERHRVLHSGPALVAATTLGDGRFAGLHFTWIDINAPKGRPVLLCPETGVMLPPKKVRGQQQGARIVLVPGGDEPCGMASGEGIESTLSVWTSLVRQGRAEAGWLWAAAVSLGNLAGPSLASVAHPTLKNIGKDGKPRPQRVPGPEPKLTERALPVPDSVRELLLLRWTGLALCLPPCAPAGLA